MKRLTPRGLLLVGSALLAAGGCRPDFAPYNRLTNPLAPVRVLGIKSEPPTPTTGETATLSALVFTPTDDPTLTYSWSWCPYPGPTAEGHPCLVDDGLLTQLLEAAALKLGVPAPMPPPLDLGANFTATLSNALDPTLLASFCAGMPGAPAVPDCKGGVPIQIGLTVTTSTDRVDAVFTTRWRFDSALVPSANPPANANPKIEKLTSVAEDIPEPNSDPTIQTIDPTIQTITLPRNSETPIAAVATMDQAETYVGPDPDGIFTSQTERLFLTWFVETGVTQHVRTSYNANSTPFDDLLKNHWTPGPSKDYPSGDARLFVVIHDSRNGVDWRRGFVHLEPTP